ncbi:hypothetical protein [Fluviispira multicolorata]|uniref:Uncharacterized protein n=1 Tax=Fluviispira multicolorata TaxID=2654512 RepID=A0A833N6U4_9BACT|nr:hypothetical protein [Fluviispira multicolorata]KAB8030908.1 hypothetical protein GCL57_08015 [Fluviispira multicolorata]
MEVQLKDGIYFVSGDITETCDLGGFGLPSGSVHFDLGSVRTINSCGVREWITWINKLKITPIYSNCPQSVVMQFNMVKEFLSNNSKVESFQIPAYCENCGEQKIYLLRSGKEFQFGKKLEYELKKCEKDGCCIESDVDFESYFYFIESLKS